MKKTERIISAVLTMIIGVLLILMKDSFIGVLMSVIGLGLIVFGVVDCLDGEIPSAIVKMVGGALVIVCGWLIVAAVLYVMAAVLLLCGIMLLYQHIKRKTCGDSWIYTAIAYAPSVLCIIIGALLLFHQSLTVNFIFVSCGFLTLIEGGLWLFTIFLEEE